jgi:hypothetical protein
MKLNYTSTITVNDNYTIKKNKIDDSIQLFYNNDIYNDCYIVNKIFFNKLYYYDDYNKFVNIEIESIKLVDTKKKNQEELENDELIIYNKNSNEYNMVNNDNILYYIMYYNDNIIYKNDNYVEKFIMKNKIEDCYNNMLCDILFLLSFYGNDFTLLIECMNIDCIQSFITLFIIYIRSFIEHNQNKKKIEYLTVDNSCFFSKIDENNENDNNDFFKIILKYFSKYEELYINSLIPDIIEENDIENLYKKLRNYNLNKYKYIYIKSIKEGSLYKKFNKFYNCYYNFYNIFKEEFIKQENDIITYINTFDFKVDNPKCNNIRKK